MSSLKTENGAHLFCMHSRVGRSTGCDTFELYNWIKYFLQKIRLCSGGKKANIRVVLKSPIEPRSTLKTQAQLPPSWLTQGRFENHRLTRWNSALANSTIIKKHLTFLWQLGSQFPGFSSVRIDLDPWLPENSILSAPNSTYLIAFWWNFFLGFCYLQLNTDLLLIKSPWNKHTKEMLVPSTGSALNHLFTSEILKVPENQLLLILKVNDSLMSKTTTKKSRNASIRILKCR